MNVVFSLEIDNYHRKETEKKLLIDKKKYLKVHKSSLRSKLCDY